GSPGDRGRGRRSRPERPCRGGRSRTGPGRPGRRLGRAEAAVDRDIETTFLPVPELLGDEGEAVGAERQPWQREFDRGRGANDRRGGKAECAGGAGDAGEPEKKTPMEGQNGAAQ